MKVSIVGGTGNMGKLMAYLLQKHGFEVFLLGRKSEDFKEKIKDSEVVFFSVPIFSMEQTLKLFEKIDIKDKLLVDLSSGVSENNDKLIKYSPFVSFAHLMFGPDIYDIKNQNIIVSDYTKSNTFAKIVSVFKEEGAHVTVCDPKRHDYMMSIVQALSQFSSISLAKTISEEKTNAKELGDFSSITFSLNADVISRIFSQNSELWAAIQFNNSFFKKILDNHIRNIKELASYVDRKDYEKFNLMFKKVANFWKKEDSGISVSRIENKKTKVLKKAVGVLGPKGSYSEQVLIQNNAKDSHIFFDSIGEIITALSLGKIQKAILPFENSIQGTVLETLDGVYQHGLKINKEIVLKIEHVIAGLDKKISINQIEYIYSHPQALGQCRGYLEKKYPKAKLVLTPSTSSAFKKIKDEGLTNSLAIGSKFASQIYGLSVVDQNIQDVKNNQTLFVVVSKRDEKEILPFTFLVINPKKDKSGILHDMLSVFKNSLINLLKIESRPSKENLGKYIFYIKAEISSDDKRRPSIIKELRKFGKVTLITK